MAAVLTYAARKTEDWAPYLEDCRKTRFADHTEESPNVGIADPPAEYQHPQASFTVAWEEGEVPTNTNGHIRFGLGAIKVWVRSPSRASSRNAEKVDRSPACTISPDCLRGRSTGRRLKPSSNPGVIDELHGVEQRSSMLASLDEAISIGSAAAADKAAGQNTMFGMFEDNETDETVPEVNLHVVS